MEQVYSGKIIFSGRLVAPLSDYDIPNINSYNKSLENTKENVVCDYVNMPVVSINTLSIAEEEFGLTLFVVDVKNIPVGVSKVHCCFDALMNNETGNLINTAESNDSTTGKHAARNVEIRLYNVIDHTQIKVGDLNSEFFDVVNRKATLFYAGGYYATDKATEGEIYAEATVTILWDEP
ncbi:fimbrial protein [Enterobacteriaceae bacterium LUAb1]